MSPPPPTIESTKPARNAQVTRNSMAAPCLDVPRLGCNDLASFGIRRFTMDAGDPIANLPSMCFPKAILALAVLVVTAVAAPQQIFDGGANIGGPRFPGSIQFNSATGDYTVTGGGSNMWFSADAFY